MNYLRNVGSAKRLSVNSRIKGLRTLLFGLFFVFAVAFGVQRATIGDAKLALRAANVPNAPTNLSAVALSTSAIALQWQDNSSDEIGFQIERCLGATCTNFISIATVGANYTSFTNTGLPQGTTYRYRVAAQANGNKLSAYTNIASSTTLVAIPASTPTPTPTPAATPTPTPSGSWTFCANETQQCNFGGTAQVRYGANGFYNYGTFTNGVLCANTIFGDPAPGVAKHCDDASSTSTPTPTPTPTPTATPTPTPTPTPSGWTFCANETQQCNFGGTMQVRYGANGGVYTYGTFTNGVLCANTIFGDPDPGVAKHCDYTTSTSTPTPTPTPSSTPAAPSNLVATAVSTTQINLTWIDNSSNESGFRIDRALVSTGPWTQVGDLLANTTSWGNAALSANTLYYYRVYAYNTAGNSGYSNVASATTQSLTAPSAPTANSATNVTSSSFTANWSTSSGATGYRLDVSASSTFGTFMSGYQDRDVGNVLSFGVSGLSAGTTYYYRVRAYSTGGTSGNSNVASATTAAAPTPTPTPAPTPTSSPWSKAITSPYNDYGQAVAFDSSGNVYVTGSITGTVNFGGSCGTLSINSSSTDAFVAKYSSGGTCLWAKAFGGYNTFNSGYGVAVDSSSYVIVTGYFAGTADFAQDGIQPAVTGQPGSNIFLAKYDQNGNYQWANTFGDPNGGDPEIAYGVAVDTSGNVAITGQFVGTLNFGGGPISANSYKNIFAAKFSASGAHMWSKGFNNSLDAAGWGVAMDSGGNVVITGWFNNGPVNFGCGSLSNAGGHDSFAAKLSSSSGGCQWSRAFGDGADQYGTGVAVDPGGNVYLTGKFQGTMNFGGGNVVGIVGQNNIYLAKLDSSGNFSSGSWAKKFGVASESNGLGVATDTSSNVVITGSYSGAVDFGGGPIASNSLYPSTFVAKYDQYGNYKWATGFVGTNQNYGNGVAIDGNGNVGLTGYFAGSVDFGQGTLTSAGRADAFVLKLGP